VSQPLSVGLKKTYQWIKSQVDKKENETVWIYESPDGEIQFIKENPKAQKDIKLNN
jgi:hypothetical protein